jgi:hypothetical protein
LGVDWRLVDGDGNTEGDQFWATEFAADGATEGASALRLTHPANAWQLGLILDTPLLIEHVANNNALEFDMTVTPDSIWRAVWVIMQGDGLGWAQAQQVDLAAGQTTPVAISLTVPDPADTTKNWKEAASLSGGTWWQIFIAVMGDDSFSPETWVSIDNFRFTGGAGLEDADFDNDGVVDGFDLMTWETAFAVDGTGDANLDGVTDGADLLIWQRQFGQVNAFASAAPEPSAGLLALAASLLGYARRPRRQG